MTVRELRRALFEIEDQEAEVHMVVEEVRFGKVVAMKRVTIVLGKRDGSFHFLGA